MIQISEEASGKIKFTTCPTPAPESPHTSSRWSGWVPLVRLGPAEVGIFAQPPLCFSQPAPPVPLHPVLGTWPPLPSHHTPSSLGRLRGCVSGGFHTAGRAPKSSLETWGWRAAPEYPKDTSNPRSLGHGGTQARLWNLPSDAEQLTELPWVWPGRSGSREC